MGNKERGDLQAQLVLVVGEAQFGWGGVSRPRVAGAAASADAPEGGWDGSCHGVTYGSRNDCAGMACGMESAGLLLKEGIERETGSWKGGPDSWDQAASRALRQAVAWCGTTGTSTRPQSVCERRTQARKSREQECAVMQGNNTTQRRINRAAPVRPGRMDTGAEAKRHDPRR